LREQDSTACRSEAEIPRHLADAGRPTDSKGRNSEIQKYRNFKQLILFNFFNQLLVSFGNVWKHLTLTGTIWAQSSFSKNGDVFFLNRLFWYQNHHFKPKKRDCF
jgi:hypothetical protein